MDYEILQGLVKVLQECINNQVSLSLIDRVLEEMRATTRGKKDPIKKDPIKKDPIKKDPIKKDPIKNFYTPKKGVVLDKTKGLNVLSLFDGMSCGQIALERAGVKVDNYFASEIKKHAVSCTLDNYPNTIHLGDIREIKSRELPKIDLLIGGSPCQDFSNLKANGKGLEGEKSKLFYEYLRLLIELNPTHFLLENVAMKHEYRNQLSEILGVEGILINSSLVSFQKRPRIYWTNLPGVTLPKDKEISFQYYKDTDYEYCKQFKVNDTPSRRLMYEKQCPNVTYKEKVHCLTCKQDRRSNSGLIDFDGFCRFLTTRELELAQTVPVGYTKSVTMRQAEDLLGDGWTVDVIVHILNCGARA